MSCFMVINGSCSTNMCARQLSFNFSSPAAKQKSDKFSFCCFNFSRFADCIVIVIVTNTIYG